MGKTPITGRVLHSGRDLPRLPGNAVAGRALSAPSRSGCLNFAFSGEVRASGGIACHNLRWPATRTPATSLWSTHRVAGVQRLYPGLWPGLIAGVELPRPSRQVMSARLTISVELVARKGDVVIIDASWIYGPSNWNRCSRALQPGAHSRRLLS